MTLNRRLLIAGGSALMTGAFAMKGYGQVTFADTPFTLGVAAGDPAPDGFVIWTRLAPRPLEDHGGMPMVRTSVTWDVAADADFRQIVRSGEAIAYPDLGHSVHVEVAGLLPARPYWYRFTVGPHMSDVGRAKTAPVAGAKLDHVRFAVAGCQAYDSGFYTAFRHIADEEVDFLFHYGDYIYEGAGKTDPNKPRQHLAGEIYSLDDYRRRYALYKLDADLQAAHASCAWFVTMDDHEITENWAGDFDSRPTPPEVFRLRRQAAFQAYYEHMPLRRSSLPRGPDMQLYRRTIYGDLLNANFMDTRQFRTDQPCGDSYKKIYCDTAVDPKGQMMSAVEEKWLIDSLHKPQARWNLMAQQVMMMPMDRRNAEADGDTPMYNLDSWTGYPVARQRLVDHLKGLGNVITLAGDEHQNFSGEIRDKGRDGKAVAIEFVTTSVSSGGDGADVRKGTDILMSHNPQLKFENDQRGYMICDVGRDTWTSHFRVLDYVSRAGSPVRTRQSFVVERGIAAVTPV